MALFVTDADQTICRSQERYNAFRSTFLGSSIPHAPPTGPAGALSATSVASDRIAAPFFCGSGAAAPTYHNNSHSFHTQVVQKLLCWSQTQGPGGVSDCPRLSRLELSSLEAHR